jgi:phospholipid/cholesterol/gamma-HCH transport system ATP-binding protein
MSAFPDGTSTGGGTIMLRDVHKRFGSKVVLDSVDLSVTAGESLVIIGGSGTGKSVTLKCILGLLTPERGSIKVDGEDVVGLRGAALDRHRARFGMLFQGGALFDSLPVWRNVTFALQRGRGGHSAEMRRVAVDNLALVGLGPDVADLRPAELSGGMQKRVALARAITHRPQIIFFDEPTTGLDPIMADVINDLIIGLVRQLGVTAVTITHDMSSVRKIADRVAMLHKGRVVWEGPREAVDDSGNAYVEQFVHGRAEGPIRMETRRL